MIRTTLLPLGLALMLGLSGTVAPAQTSSHEGHAVAELSLTLNNGAKWQGDASMIQGMSGIRDAMVRRMGSIHDNTLPSDNYPALAAEVKGQVESTLAEAMTEADMPFTLNPGEGAFYGPKIEFQILDALRRPWQLGTLQVDYMLPERFELHYTMADGSEGRPVMLHRAILGSLERFIGILVEHTAGAFPLWLAPVQAVVLPITDRVHDYARSVAEEARALGLRVELDLRNEKVNAKIRDHQLMKVPYMLVIGDREAASAQVAVRHRHAGDQGARPTAEFLAAMKDEAGSRRR